MQLRDKKKILEFQQWESEIFITLDWTPGPQENPSDIGEGGGWIGNQSVNQRIHKSAPRGPSALRLHRQTSETWSLRIIKAQTVRSHFS